MKQNPISRSAERMRSVTLAALIATVPVAVGLAGCGSNASHIGSGGDTSTSGSALSRAQGRASFTFTWPARTATRLIPIAANSIKVNVLGVGGAVVATQTIARPASGALTATVTFGGLNVGIYSVTATAYPNADGTGTAQATVQTTVTIVGGQTVPLNLTMASSIAGVAVTPTVDTLKPGQTVTILATPRNTVGQTVLVATNAIQWVSSNNAVATVDSTGKVTAISTGAATITATETESGKSGSIVIIVTTFASTSLPKATTYQMNPSHSGSVTFGQNLNFTANPTWSVDLGATVSYPVIADGKIFVTVGDDNSGGVYELYALDETTGHTAWGPVHIGGLVGLTYDNGKVFAISNSSINQKVVQSFDAATGMPGWSTAFLYNTPAPPIAVNGVLYADQVLDEANGNPVWGLSLSNGSDGSPTIALDGNGKSIGVYTSHPCQVTDYDPKSSVAIWFYGGPCTGGGGETAAYANGLLYSRDLVGGNLIFDAVTGKIAGSFNSDQIPALGATMGFFMNGRALQGVDLMSRAILWSFVGDGHLVTAPILIDQTVITGSTSGTIYALNANTGAQLWSASVGTPIPLPIDQSGPLTGLAAGEGYLVVPAGTTISAWHLAGQ